MTIKARVAKLELQKAAAAGSLKPVLVIIYDEEAGVEERASLRETALAERFGAAPRLEVDWLEVVLVDGRPLRDEKPVSWSND